jgi:pyruvate-formate lyase
MDPYQRDLVAGRITAERAQELIECLYIKCSEIIGYGDQANRETRKRSLCQDSVQYVVLGGQTPDGRNAVNPLSTICLKAGYLQLKQPTCLFSIAKLPTHRTPGGGTNLRLHPSAVQGEAGLQALSSLLKTYFGLGGQYLQLNILDSAVLKRAQQHPEEYRTLSVRVVGYSAYFCALTQEVQDDIIRRTEHTR